MGMLINFSAELKDWISHNLDRGCAPADIVASMVRQQFQPAVASALVEAFRVARARGTPVPGDCIELDIEGSEYIYAAPRIATGPIIHTFDRTIRVLARLAEPVAALLENVLSAEECEQIIAMAHARLQPSTVVDPISGKNIPAEYRTSAGMFFRLQENPLIARLDRRCAEIMNLSIENGEGLQVLHYGVGCKSEPHFDYLIPDNQFNRESLARSGQRVSTLVVYLNDVETGGETYFPEVGFAITPKRGSAIYFEYANDMRQVDPKSLHASAPVLAGEKWVMTKWMREKPFVRAIESSSN